MVWNKCGPNLDIWDRGGCFLKVPKQVFKTCKNGLGKWEGEIKFSFACKQEISWIQTHMLRAKLSSD